MGNYVDFVSDEHFLKCVKEVCDTYLIVTELESEEEKIKWLTRNGLDSIKAVFDMMNGNMNFDQWKEGEFVRQLDKTVSNRVGDFHQKLLGGVKDWVNLPTGNPTGVDLKNNSETIFIELKNKHNTVKGEDEKNVFDKLEKIVKNNPSATAYFAYINPKDGTSGEKIWEVSRRNPNPRVIEIWGSRVYELVTGKPTALEEMWAALPNAICDNLQKNKLDQTDLESLKMVFNYSLKRSTEQPEKNKKLEL